jgi:putative ABC transport system substrate-binding protein
MDRRAFISVLGGSILAGPLAGETQHPPKVARIGILGAVSPDGAPHTNSLRVGFRELGYVEGQNIVSDWRWALGDAKRFPDLAAELVRLNVDVIVADNDPAIAAAQRATKTIPIVMVIATDPVRLGFVKSLARPGGNITGLSFQGTELGGKRLELLKETLPNLTRVAQLWDPSEATRIEGVKETEAAGKTLKMEIRRVGAPTSRDLEGAFATMARENVGAVAIGGSSMIYPNRQRIAELAVRHRLPTVCGARGYAEAGCLIAYGADFADMFRRAAVYVDISKHVGRVKGERVHV